jgi:hypothetical protein
MLSETTKAKLQQLYEERKELFEKLRLMDERGPDVSEDDAVQGHASVNEQRPVQGTSGE